MFAGKATKDSFYDPISGPRILSSTKCTHLLHTHVVLNFRDTRSILCSWQTSPHTSASLCKYLFHSFDESLIFRSLKKSFEKNPPTRRILRKSSRKSSHTNTRTKTHTPASGTQVRVTLTFRSVGSNSRSIQFVCLS